MIYADIIIDISSDKLDRSFQYRVPERLEKKIKAVRRHRHGAHGGPRYAGAG